MFPGVRARSLEGLDVELTGGFASAQNVVAIAFERDQQSLVDSWVPWFEEHAATDPRLHFYATLGHELETVPDEDRRS
jgi:hypothetical protein